MSSGLELAAGDLARLERLRDAFLSGRGRSPWRDERDLQLYDEVFGRRIGWKWDAVLDELARRGFEPPSGEVMDFGCGSGVAARAWIARHRASVTSVRLVDASPLAAEYARRSLASADGALEIALERGGTGPATLLVSHVIGELSNGELAELVVLARSARCVVWVEPGSRDTSRALSGVRDALLDEFEALAPCTRRTSCPVLEASHAQDWCHSFARPPAEVFTSGSWARIGTTLSIDLRSLPYAYVALRRRTAEAPAVDLDGERVLGRAKIEKGRLRFQACGPQGLRELRLLERDDGALFERLEDSVGRALTLRIEAENGRVKSARELH